MRIDITDGVRRDPSIFQSIPHGALLTLHRRLSQLVRIARGAESDDLREQFSPPCRGSFLALENERGSALPQHAPRALAVDGAPGDRARRTRA